MNEKNILLIQKNDQTAGRAVAGNIKKLIMLASGYVLVSAAWLYLLLLTSA